MNSFVCWTSWLRSFTLFTVSLVLAAPPAAPAQNSCVPVPSGLVSWWSGDDSALDYAGRNHGLMRSGAAFGEGKVGRAFVFNTDTAAVEAPVAGINVGGGDFSIDGWIRTTATKEFSAIVALGSAPGVYLTGATGALRVWPASASASGGFNDGQFHHFAVVRRAGVLTYYRDSLAIGTAAYLENVSQDIVRIGSDSFVVNRFSGTIDELDFFDRALSDQEIRTIFLAGAAGKCKPASVLAPQSGSFFIEAEDFDFGAGQHKSEADTMPYYGGAYLGLGAVAEIDYHDPGANENAAYRPGTQGVATTSTGDSYRDGYDVVTGFRVGWMEEGEWMNFSRIFPGPTRDYHVYAHLSSGALSNAVQLDKVVSGLGTTNQTLLKIGEARGRASGDWNSGLFAPFTDASGNLARIALGGYNTLRVTVLPQSNEDFNFLHFVPVPAASEVPCVSPGAGLIARWRAEGNAADTLGTSPGSLQNGTAFTAGRFGQAFSFDGVDDYISTTVEVQPSVLPATTWEGWVFPTRLSGRQQILSSDDGGFDRSLGVEGKYFGVFVGDTVWTPTTISPNQWQHVAVVYTPTNTLFYKNGVRYLLGRSAPGQGTQFRLQIGRNPGFGEHFQGRVDELAIYNRALTEAEIAALACPVQVSSSCPTLTLSPESLANGVVGVDYTQTLSVSGGGTHTFAVVNGLLPPGLALSANGTLAGRPANVGSFTFTVQVTNPQSCVGVRTYTITIFRTSTGLSCDGLERGLISWWRGEGNFQDAIGANDGTNVNQVTFAPGKVGLGFQFKGTNYISTPLGSMTNIGGGDFSVDGWIQTRETKSFTTIVSFNRFTPAIYVTGSAGQLQLWGTDGSPVGGFNDGNFHHFAVVRENGRVTYYKDGQPIGSTGSPGRFIESSGSFYLGNDLFGGEEFVGIIDEIDVFNRALSSAEVLAIFSRGSQGKCNSSCPPITLVPATVPGGNVGVAYSQPITASGGAAPYTYSVTSGTLPPGLVLSAAGNLSGTPASSGTFPFTVSARDATGQCSGSGNYSLAIAPAPAGAPNLSVTPNPLAYGSVVLNQAKDLSLTLANLGTTALTVSSLTRNGSPMFQVTTPVSEFSLVPGAQRSFTVRYLPTAAGVHTATVAITSNDPDQPTINVPVSGTGETSASAAPVLHALVPANGTVGSQVALFGLNFGPGLADNIVRVAGVIAEIRAAAPDRLDIIVPSVAPGLANVRVTRNGEASDALVFEVLSAPQNVALRAVRNPDGSVLVSWPAGFTNLVLEYALSLNLPTVWQPVTQSARVSGNLLQVVMPPTDAPQFFRLRDPVRDVPQLPVVVAGKTTVTAATGGEVQLPGGALTLAVPPGALTQDITITVTNYEYQPHPDERILNHIVFGPSGLQFSKPAKLSVKVPMSAAALADIAVYSASAVNPPRDVGSEISYFQKLTNVTFNARTGELEVMLDHFSVVTILLEERQYLVLDIPGKYLKRGDILFTLTGIGSWFPGHVGMYTGTRDATVESNDGTTVIESTSESARFHQTDGVQFGELPQFQNLAGQHIYMGARRLRHSTVTDEERNQIIAFAISKTNVPYLTLGSSIFTSDRFGFSCIGLVDAAYKSVGKSISDLPEPVGLPIRAYSYTSAINEITVEEGEKIAFGVRGVLKTRPELFVDYSDAVALYTITLTGDREVSGVDPVAEGRAKLDPNSFLFTYNPSAQDAELTHKFVFTMEPRGNFAKVTMPLFVSVKAKGPSLYRRKDPPQIFNGFGTGNLSETNLVISATGAQTAGQNSTASPFRLSWDPPPATVGPDQFFTMTINADVGTNNPAEVTTAFRAPYIAAEINDSVVVSLSSAWAGYEFVSGTPANNRYRLVQRSLTKQVKADGFSTSRFVTIEVEVSRSSGAFTSGTVRKTVQWEYEPVQ